MDNELQAVRYATSRAFRIQRVDWLATSATDTPSLQGLDGLQ